ncbi:hypothetical protein INP81_08055 [Comamonas thiooxydans]|uniref:hypothetical protein n=1 Tax=Comamonas thiooxydans TaxID=363952 RepID=UPI0018A5E204|nr:hypothetical protein [Comamonas thiooxydans]QOQ83789.1 hypothetical protein INP81_08055 [Comamonas thiooxydans]
MPLNKDAEKSQKNKQPLVSSALYLHTGNLQGKLYLIWQLADFLVTEAEAKHTKEIIKLWSGSAPKNDSLSNKSKKLPQNIPISLNELTQAYFHVLKTIADIYKIDRFLRMGSDQPELQTTSNEAENFSALIMQKNLLSKDFLDIVVSVFFNLQSHCHDLALLLENPSGTPLNPHVRRIRAAKGGNAKAFGEDILRSQFLVFLESMDGRIFPSKKAFWHQCGDEIFGIFQTYQNEYIGKIHHKLNKKIAYGQDLKVESLERKFKQWSQNDPEFKNIWENLFPPKKKFNLAKALK